MLDVEFVIYTVHNVRSMSCCSVHIVYQKPTLCESLARAKILQSECKYPETKNQVVKHLHVLLRSTPAAICLRLLAISCGGLVAICTIGHRPAKNVSCYVLVDICTIAVPETMRDYGGSEYLR